MKILITADVHLGLSGRLDDIIWSLSKMRDYAAENNIKYILVLGDLFDNRSSIGIDALTLSYKFFKDCKLNYGQKWVVFPGNHDMFLKNSWEINSLVTLGDVMDVYCETSNIDIDGRKFIILPFVHNEDTYMSIVDKLLNDADKTDILLTHIGVNNAIINECFLIKYWSKVNFTTYPNRVFAGHFHCNQTIANLTYPGSPIPFKYDEGMVRHGFIEFDTGNDCVVFIDLMESNDTNKPPDFITITDDMIDAVDSAVLSKNNIRVVLSREYTHTERLKVAEKLEMCGVSRINWKKSKTENIDSWNHDVNVLFDDYSTILKRWYDIDKPDYIDKDMLFKLNDEIITEGNELIKIESDLDE